MSTLTPLEGFQGLVTLDGRSVEFKIVSGTGLGLEMNDTPHGSAGKTYKTSPTLATVLEAAKAQGLLPAPIGLVAAFLGEHGHHLKADDRISAVGENFLGERIEGGTEPMSIATEFKASTGRGLEALYLFVVAPTAAATMGPDQVEPPAAE